MNNKVLQSFGKIRGVDSVKHTVEAVICTGAVARDGAVVNPMGGVYGNFEKNPIVLVAHDASALPVGRCVSHVASPTEVVAVTEFDVDDPEAARLFGKIERGYVNGTSIRWTPIETSVRMIDGREVLSFDKWELLEYSYCSLPVDAGALVVRSMDGAPLDVAALVGAATKRTLDLPAGMSYDDLSTELREQFKASNPGTEYVWIADLFADTAVFSGDDDDYWQQAYTCDADCNVALVGTPVLVERVTSWQPAPPDEVAEEAAEADDGSALAMAISFTILNS